MRVFRAPGRDAFRWAGEKDSAVHMCRQKECLQRPRKNRGLSVHSRWVFLGESCDMLWKEFDELGRIRFVPFGTCDEGVT